MNSICYSSIQLTSQRRRSSHNPDFESQFAFDLTVRLDGPLDDTGEPRRQLRYTLVKQRSERTDSKFRPSTLRTLLILKTTSA